MAGEGSAEDANASAEKEKRAQHERAVKRLKIGVIKRVVVLGIVLAAVLTLSTHLPWPRIEIYKEQYLLYLQAGEVAVVGFFVIEVVGSASYKLVAMHSQQTAKAVLSLTRIVGAIIVAAIITSFLSKDPIIAVSISTISGLVVGFASQNIIGNMIAGMYLVLSRPFKIGDSIVVFDKEGVVEGIQLLCCRVAMENGDVMLAPNTALVTTSVVIKSQKKWESETRSPDRNGKERKG